MRSPPATSACSRILASISDCYFTLDHDFIVTDINDAALRWLKLARDEVVGRSCFEEFPSFPVQRAAMTRAAREGRPLHLEVPSSIRPGRWLDFHVYPSPEGYSVFFRDISERMIAVQTLEKTKGLLDSTLNALSAYVVILDEKGTILLVNQAWRQFLDRSGRFIPDDGIGANYRSLNILPPIVRSNMRRVQQRPGTGPQRRCRGLSLHVPGERRRRRTLVPRFMRRAFTPTAGAASSSPTRT